MMQDLGKVGVLYGGRSAEREVSLMSGAGVHAALCASGVDAHLFDPALQSLAALEQAKFQRVFIALHGRFGEDGSIQGLLESLSIPYTGSGVLASAVAMDKVYTKRVWHSLGLSTPPFEVVRSSSQLRAAAQRLGLPVAVKPPHEGSTLGFSKLQHLDDAEAAYVLAATYEDEVLVESFIQGRELTVAILGSAEQARALPIIEIVAPQGNYDYEHKYFADDTQYVCPANLPDEVAARVQTLALEAYRGVGCEGWGRVDVMLRAADQMPFLLEVNTSPGMTSHSLVPMAARAVGISYEQLCLNLLQSASCKVRACNPVAVGVA